MLEARLIVSPEDPVARVAAREVKRRRMRGEEKKSKSAWLWCICRKREKERESAKKVEREKDKKKRVKMKGTGNEGASETSRGSYTNFPIEVGRTPWVHLVEPFLEDPSI